MKKYFFFILLSIFIFDNAIALTSSDPVGCAPFPGWCSEYYSAGSEMGFWGSDHVMTGSNMTWKCVRQGRSVSCSGNTGICGKALSIPLDGSGPSQEDLCQPGNEWCIL
jgi:hypothetical protein